MDWNKENKLPLGPGDKNGRRSAKAAGTGAEGSGGQPFDEGEEDPNLQGVHEINGIEI